MESLLHLQAFRYVCRRKRRRAGSWPLEFPERIAAETAQLVYGRHTDSTLSSSLLLAELPSHIRY
jgi:hypothetical protein